MKAIPNDVSHAIILSHKKHKKQKHKEINLFLCRCKSPHVTVVTGVFQNLIIYCRLLGGTKLLAKVPK